MNKKTYEVPVTKELFLTASTMLMASGPTPPGGGGDSPGGSSSVPIKRPGSDFPTHR